MITQQRLKDLLSYDPETGVFSWTPLGRKRKHTEVAGTVDIQTGYRKIWLDGRVYYAHRLAYLCVTGSFPKELIDHKNADRDDNRWDNLRDADMSRNLFNARLRSDNTSGYKGVSFSKVMKQWRAYLNVDGKAVVIGHFHAKKDAALAYNQAAISERGEFARVNVL